MADRANSTAAPEVHPIPQGSPPGAPAQPFEPVANAPRNRPRPHPRRDAPPAGLHLHPLGLRYVSDEAEVIALAKRLTALQRRVPALVHQVDALRLHHLLPRKRTRMERALLRTWKRVDLWTAQLAATSAPTARASYMKAGTLIETALLDGRREEPFDALAISLAHDVDRLFLEAELAQASGVMAGGDADLIDLARRVKALAERDHRAHERLADLTDVMHREVGFPPRRPTPPIGLEYKTEVVGDLHMTILTRPLETPERDAILAAHEIAVADHARREREVEQRLGLPALDKRVTRMARRLVRWSKRLTAMEPRTPAGLKAKAEAQIAIDRGGSLDDWTQELASSVGRDAVRIATALADVPPAGDAELLDLIARHGPAMAEWDAADEAQTPFGYAWFDARPPRPHALYWSASDRGRASLREKVPDRETYYLVYDEADIDRMRDKPVFSIVEHREPAYWDPNDTIVRRERVPDEAGEARRIQIITAWDSWQAEIERLKETTGLNAANAVVEAVAQRVNAIEDAILDYQPTTFEGLQAKARWIASTPIADKRARHLMRDLCNMRPVAMALPSTERAGPPDHRAVEAYRQWLHLEGRYLAREMYPQAGEAADFIPWNTAANSFHDDAFTPGRRPSDRAESMCRLLGIDWTTKPLESQGRPHVACATRAA